MLCSNKVDKAKFTIISDKREYHPMNLPLYDKKFLFLLAAIVIVIGLEVLSLAGWNLPMPWASFVYAGFIIAIGYEVVWKGLRAAARLNFASINLLMVIACVGAFYLGEYPEAAVVIVLYVLGERLEDIGIENSRSALEELMQRLPKTAFIAELGRQIPIEEVPVGSVVQVRPGEMIPLDGIVVSGSTAVDEATITGESVPRDKHKGSTVYAGTLNKTGFIELTTTALSADTTYSKIIRLTFEASANKGETQKFIQRFSRYYTPAVIALSALVFTIPVLLLNQNPQHWLLQAITLLVIACPCALVISTPVAIYAAIGNASRRGALVKGGKYIEELGRVRAIAFDKTRTITVGTPVVSDVIPFGDTTREELLACTAGAEMFSEHPVAQAIVDASRREGYEPHSAGDFMSVTGKGAKATCYVCDDEPVVLGNLQFVKEHDPISVADEQTVERLTNEGKTSVVVSFGKGIAGVLALTDEIKSDSEQSIRQLTELGVTSVMLSGDSEKAARYVADKVGIDTVYAGLLPEEKVDKLNELLKEYGSVAMVGDGVNDAPALAQASVGLAMGATGSDTTIETANIALMNDNLSLLPFLVRLSRKTVLRIQQNTIGAILVKLLFILLAFIGYSNLVLAIAADVGVTLVVIVLSLQLLQFE